MRVEDFFASFNTEADVRRYFVEAKDAGIASKMREPIGACLVTTKGNIVTGYNMRKMHPYVHRISPTLGSRHAEIQTIIRCLATRIDPTNGTIFVYRQNRLKNIGMARPCFFCEKTLRKIGIKNMFYTTHTGYNMERL